MSCKNLRGLGLWPLAVVAVGCGTTRTPPATQPTKAPASQPKAPAGPKVALQLFTMSMCPYAGAAERGLRALVDTVGDRISLRVDYILEEKEGQLSLHGPKEVAGDIVELCAMALQPDPKRYLAFVGCQNLDREAIPTRWETCAKKTGFDLEQMRKCFGSQQGASLLVASMKRAAAAGVRASPTVLVDGKPYDGPRDARGLLRVVCGRLGAAGSALPAACAGLPALVPVEAVVLTDRRCAECQQVLPALERNLRERFFPRLTVKRLDYGEAAGKALYERLKLSGLPAVLLPRAAEKAERFTGLTRFIEPREEFWRITVPAPFDPTAEICDNGKDDTGDGKVDCADATCKQVLSCRKEIKGRLEIFTMAHCPFCHQALLSLDDAIKRLGARRVRFDIHFVADRKADGTFEALHGKAEVDENIRQLCARKHYARGRRYLKYIRCRIGDKGGAWTPCAVTAKLKPAVIEKCVKSGEGARLLGADIAVAKALRINATPTWMANNKHLFKGITAEAIVAGFCKHNPKVPACRK